MTYDNFLKNIFYSTSIGAGILISFSAYYGARVLGNIYEELKKRNSLLKERNSLLEKIAKGHDNPENRKSEP